LVDDDADVRYALGKYLRRAGHEVVEAGDGKAALFLLKDDSFDTIVTDIIMPEADGIELVMAVRRRTPGLPIIAISGGGRLGSLNYLSMAAGLGAKIVLSKPVDPDTLLAAVDKVVGHPSSR
jgi:CheY-like chemotaxis protein